MVSRTSPYGYPRSEPATGEHVGFRISEERECRKCFQQFPVNDWQRNKKYCDNCSDSVKLRGRAERRAER